MELEFLPRPKTLERRPGTLPLTPHTRVVLDPGTAPGALLYAKMVQRAVTEYAGLTPALGRGKPGPGDLCLTLDPALPAGRYTLTVDPAGARVAAGDDEALCNGAQTLIQLVQCAGAVLPALGVEDWPDLPDRGYYQDCSRGRVPTLARLKAVADLLCRYKINQWQLYIEHTYLFRNLSEAWRDDTPLTADDILELDDYCAARHIELVPSLASFGHMYKILSTRTCCELCELPDSEKIPFGYAYAGAHHTLNVSHPGALDFVLGLIDEYRPLFRSRKFNICADETFDLGRGRSKALADEVGEKTLYIRHVKALCDHLVAQGCTPMFWGDILWRFPQSCAELPPQTICLNWGYRPDQPEDAIRAMAEQGIPQYACPGVCGWNHWVPVYRDAYRNIRTMCAHAHKYRAVGLLNTDWGDYGHINDPRLSLPGILYGAAFGWDARPAEQAELNRAISRLAYGDATGTLADALTDLSGHEVFPWAAAVHWLEGDDARRAKVLAKLDLSGVEAANAAVAAARDRVLACAAALPAGHKEIVALVCVTAEGVQLWNEIGAWVAGPRQENPALACRLEHWYALYLAQWRQTSRESGLPNLTRFIARYADLLRGRQVGAVDTPALPDFG